MGLPLPLVVATGNADKAREVIEIFVDRIGEPLVAWALTFRTDTYGYIVDRPAASPLGRHVTERDDAAPDVEETGATLEENARIKATALAGRLGMLAVADDTGLEVDALGGAPGVRSARYAGEQASYADNVAKLLHELEHAAPPQRTARFATVALARRPGGSEVVARGEVEGVIAEEPCGRGGFGYDPIFVPVEGDGRSFAEMTPAEKHAVSHRGRAFRALAVALDEEG